MAHFVAGPAREVQLLAHKAVLGFQADGAAYRAGYTTHDVTVEDGVAELTPYHQDGDARVTGGKLGLETGAITRDDGNVLGNMTRVATNGDGALELTRGDVVEVLSNREDGIRQDWRFAQAPAGTGDLTVEVQITGQRFVASTDSGLHFKSSAGLGFRYSHALWLDAAGHEWPIQAAWQDDHIAITVPVDILDQTTFPATLDPTVTAEVDIDAAVNGGTGANAQSPAIAFDGTNYLVVWSDQRLGRDDDIFAARVSQAGAILSTTGITVGATAGRQLHPDVAFAGNQFVVVWEDFKITGGAEADIAAARVSTAGVVTPLGRLAGSAQNELDPKVVGNGTNALVTWANGTDIRASLFNGTAFGGAISITADAAEQSAPAVAAKPGGNYLIAYSEGATATADLKGAFVTAAGIKSGAAFTISAGAGRQFDPAASFDGTNYVVAWSNNNAGINLFAARVSQAGVTLDTRQEGINVVGGVSVSSVAASNQELAGLTCVTGSCLVTWQDSRNLAATSFDIFAQRISTSGALTNTGGEMLVSTANRPQFAPRVATNGTDFFAVWTDERDANVATVFGSRITAGGAITDAGGLLLVNGNNRENAPAVGRSGTTFGVFWTDSRNKAGADIELVRFNGANRLDTTAKVVSSAAFSQASPSVTSAATGNFIVAWNDARNGVDRDIFAARVTPPGVVSDGNGIAVAVATGDQLLPSVASNGTVSLIAWQDRRSGNFDVLAALVDNATGAVLLGDIVVCNAAGDQGRPSVAFDTTSGQFLVVWGDDRVAADPNVFGARVTTAGAVLDPNGVAISSAANLQGSPRATFLNGTALVVWEDRRLDTQGDVFGGRVTLGAALTVLDPNGFTISGAAAGSQSQPVVGTLSGSFLVVWTDGRNVNTSGTDIFGQQIGTNGSLNGAAFAVSAGVDNEDAPAIADTTSNFARVAYDRIRTDLQTTRVETRTITASAGTGQACSNNGQCSTGFCVDSRCCDTACGGNNKLDCQACTIRATGVADGTCAFIVAGTVCRNYANTFCDLREACTGASADCPPDIGRREGQVCNTTTGAVCPANGPPGPHTCP